MHTELYDDTLLRVVWDDTARIIRIEWKEATAAMTDSDFKTELIRFAGHVERCKACGILVDVMNFRHKPGPAMQEWRVQNISVRYAAAGVTRFAFLLPINAPIPPMMNQSSPGEAFLTRAFNRAEEATAWLLEDRRDR